MSEKCTYQSYTFHHSTAFFTYQRKNKQELDVQVLDTSSLFTEPNKNINTSSVPPDNDENPDTGTMYEYKP